MHSRSAYLDAYFIECMWLMMLLLSVGECVAETSD